LTALIGFRSKTKMFIYRKSVSSHEAADGLIQLFVFNF